MARLRLRFLMQELDLQVGRTIIGRSPDCQITIEDPLVSREHAVITSDGESARIHDLGSRNGVRVNGRALSGEHLLADGDRVRIGKQEMVFSRVMRAPRISKTTGSLRHCASCRLPYAQESASCPNCGALSANSEETLSIRLDQGHGPEWQLELSLDVLSRCLNEARWEEAERVLSQWQATAVPTENKEHVLVLAEGAARFALARDHVGWAVFAVDVCSQLGFESVSREQASRVRVAISQLVAEFPVEISTAVGAWVKGPTFPPPDSSAFAFFEPIRDLAPDAVLSGSQDRES